MSIGKKLQIKSVAVVGASPSHSPPQRLYLLAEGVFDKIAIFEQQVKVGGLWNYTPETHDPLFKVPLTNANVLLEQPVCRMDGDQREPVTTTPVYGDLETNIPHPLMQFSDQDFPEGIPRFPKHDVVLAYLEKYAKNVRHLIHFSTQVVDISLQISSQGKDTWRVKTVNLLSQLEMVENFDAVVVASGRAAVPYIPR